MFQIQYSELKQHYYALQLPTPSNLSIVLLSSELVLRVEHSDHLVPTKLPPMHPSLCPGRPIHICIFQKHLQSTPPNQNGSHLLHKE
jgi:hypothetical protein